MNPYHTQPGLPRMASPMGAPYSPPQTSHKKSKRHYPTLGQETVSGNQGYPSPVQHTPPPVYNQVLNGMSQMNVGSAQQQDVPLVGQPPLIQDLIEKTPSPSIPSNLTATGSTMAQVDRRLKHATVHAFPSSHALAKKSKIPLALILQPYLESQVPVVPDTTVSRCSRCKTYINPFVQFSGGALQWTCNMCGMNNDVPQSFDWDILTQQQTDRYSRPELNYGCVDFMASTDYIVRPPQPPVYVFVIDTSFQAVQSGMIRVVADAILASLDKIPNEDGRTKVGFITVDNAVGFHKLSGDEPEILVVGDLNDIYLPRSLSDLMVHLAESRKVVEDLLAKMKTMYTHTHTPSNCLGSALQAARKLLAPTGGKIVCFQASVPTVGEGIMQPKQGMISVDAPIMTASSSFYKTLAAECTKLQICADMFVFGNTNANADLTTLNVMPRFTGGQTHFYPGFTAANQTACLRLKQEVIRLLAQQMGLEAVMRTRCSEGIVCHAFFGNCTTRVPDIMALPNVPCDQSYCVELLMEQDIPSSHVYFQTALLHTTSTGERRIRVMNLCLPVTQSASELFSSVDQVAVARTLCHQAIDKAAQGKLKDGRDYLANRTIEICQAYRQQVLGSTTTTQLSICRSLSVFPLLILGILKTPAFHDAPVPADLRAQSAILLRTLPMDPWERLVHPMLHSVHQMPPMAGTLDATGQCVYPPRLHLSSEKLEAHGCYLLQDGQDVYIWVGKQAIPPLCKDLFDVPSLDQIFSGQIPLLPQVRSSISSRLNTLIQHIQTDRQVTYYPTISIVKEDGDPMLRSRFLSHLIEDRQPTGPTNAGAHQDQVNSGMSYFQWLGYIRAKC